MTGTRVVATCLAVLLVAIASGAAVDATPGATSTDSTGGNELDVVEPGSDDGQLIGASQVAPASSTAIQETIELRRLPEDPGTIGVRTRYRVPDAVTSLEVRLPDDASVTEIDGFSRQAGSTYEWDEETDDPSIAYRHRANRTQEGDGPLDAEGDALFVDAGEWSLVQVPSVGVRGTAQGTSDLGLERHTTIDGDGAVGERMAYLGEHSEYRHTAHGQEFRLIVPASASMDESPDAVFDALSHAADALRVGDRDPEVFVVVAPTGEVDWAVRGLQVDPADVWVRDVEPIDAPENVWVHEYVHTRQGYAATDDVSWFTEGSATYYAALLTLERGGIDFDEFSRWLERGEHDPQADAVLSNPDSWHDGAEYLKGALVAGDLDRRIRVASDGDRTLSTVFQRANAHEGTLDDETFLRFVEEAGGADARTAADRYSSTSDVPDAWDADAHEEAYGWLPARVVYTHEEPPRVEGPYGQRSLPSDEPLVLYPEERLAVDVGVENTGGSAGEYDLSFAVNGTIGESRVGRLDAGASTVERFDRRFDEAGTYAISVADRRYVVEVRDPASVSVIDVAVDRSRVEPGASVVVSATVGNEDPTDYGSGTVAVTLDGETVAERTVRLGPGAETVVEETVDLDEPGTYELGVGGEVVTVEVAERRTAAGTPTSEVASVGVAVGIVVVLLLAMRLWGRADGRG